MESKMTEKRPEVSIYREETSKRAEEAMVIKLKRNKHMAIKSSRKNRHRMNLSNFTKLLNRCKETYKTKTSKFNN